jgi:hypothetical protein
MLGIKCGNCGADIKISLSDSVALENLARLDGSPSIAILCDNCEEQDAES